jgi:hypothetical protein
MGVAYVFTVSVVGLTIGVWMEDRMPAVIFPYRY